jgi:superfamily I DNA/RNA helicase
MKSVREGMYMHAAYRELLDRIIVCITQDEVPQHPEFVWIMSLHKSKGLTSKYVYVAGLIDGVIPTYANKQGDDLDRALEEQRRSLYVALTRAAEELTLSYCRQIALAIALGFGAEVETDIIRGRGDDRTCLASSGKPVPCENLALPRPE